MSEQNYQDPYATQQPQASGQQWGAQPGMGSDPYAGQAVAQPGMVGAPEHPRAQTVFILGIVGIFVGVCSFIAWYMGGQAKKEIEAGAPYSFEGNLKTGYMLGKIFSIIYIVGTVLYILFLGVTIFAALNSNG